MNTTKGINSLYQMIKLITRFSENTAYLSSHSSILRLILQNHSYQKITQQIPNQLMQKFIIKIKLTKIPPYNPKMLSKQKFQKSLHNPESLRVLLKHSRYSQIKYSKQIYNRDVRKMALFRKQVQQMERKFRLAQEKQDEADREIKEDVVHYDQNQLKELNYYVGKRVQTLPNQNTIDQSQEFKYETNKKKWGLRDRRTKFQKLPSIYSNNLIPEQNSQKTSYRLIITRPKSLSHSNNSRALLSPTKLRRKAHTIFDNNQINNDGGINPYGLVQKIKLDPQQLESAINNLQIVIYGKDKPLIQSIIHQDQINQKIRLKYNMSLKPKNLDNDSSPYLVELPFCQFVSFKKSKNSIHKIFNMHLQSAQKMAFRIYDRNGNGIIDEKDIIELFGEADKNSAIRSDLEVIIKNYQTMIDSCDDSSNTVAPRNRGLSYASEHSGKYSMRPISDISQISEISDVSIPSNKKQPNTDRYSLGKKSSESLKFQKQKFYTFLSTKKYFNSNKNKNCVVKLDWHRFKKAFDRKRPKIFYDMLDYLFALGAENIIQNHHYLNVKIANQLNGGVSPRKTKKRDKSSKDTISRMGKTKIGQMIIKAKSIQRFQAIKMT